MPETIRTVQLLTLQRWETLSAIQRQRMEFEMLRLHISNMTCGGCVKGVTRAVQGVDPTAELDVDLPHRKVVVKGNSDGRSIVEALRRAGFEASILEPARV